MKHVFQAMGLTQFQSTGNRATNVRFARSRRLAGLAGLLAIGEDRSRAVGEEGLTAYPPGPLGAAMELEGLEVGVGGEAGGDGLLLLLAGGGHGRAVVGDLAR